MLRRMQDYNIKIAIGRWGAKIWNEFKASDRGNYSSLEIFFFFGFVLTFVMHSNCISIISGSRGEQSRLHDFLRNTSIKRIVWKES